MILEKKGLVMKIYFSIEKMNNKQQGSGDPDPYSVACSASE